MPDDTTDLSTLESRLDAVERALADETHAPSSRRSDAGPDAPAETTPSPDGTTVEDLERSIADLERRVSDLTAELDAVRGLLGGVRAVDESVERRADLALAAVERLADDREADGLVVERLPEVHGEADVDADASDDTTDGRDGETADGTLAARLREAL